MWNKLRSTRATYIALSILGAIVFWLYVDIAQPSEAYVSIRGIPVSFHGAEALDKKGLLILGEDPTIDIRVSGPRSVITRLNQSNVSVTASVDNITEAGVYSTELNISLPSSVTSSTSQQVRIVSRSASAIDVSVVQMVSKTVEIRPQFTGTVAANRFYDENSFVLQQNELIIRGEQSVVDSVSYAMVTLSERNLTSTWTGWLDVQLCDKEGALVSSENLNLETESISVAFYVESQKEVPLKVTLVPGGGAAVSDATCQITPSTVTITGQQIVLDDVSEIDLGTIDLGKIITTGSYDLPIELPNGVSNRNSSQETAHVEVHVEGLETRRITVNNIVLRNAAEGFVLKPESVDVRIRGKEEAFTLLMNDDIIVTVDLTDVALTDGAVLTVPATVEIQGMSELGVLGSYNVVIAVSRGTTGENTTNALTEAAG